VLGRERQMKLRTKIIIAIALISFLIFGGLHLITALVIDPGFNNLEMQDCEYSINQALTMINYTLSNLEGQLKDYADWDDTYNFVLNRNQQYTESNFVDETFENLNLNLITIVDANRSLIFSQSYDLNASQKVQTSEQTQNVLVSDENIWKFNSTEDIISGFILIDNQPMFVASAPILTNLNQGPVMGMMLFGRTIDSRELEKLSQITNLDFKITPISELSADKSGFQILDPLLLNEATIVVNKENPSEIFGYYLISDVDSNPTFLLRITQDRVVNQQGVYIRNIFLIASIALAISIGGVFLFLMEKEVVKPMMKLAATVEEVTLNPNSIRKNKKFSSSEELELLSSAVQNSVNKRLEGMNEVSRMVAHDLRNPLSGIRNAAYVLKKNFGEKMGEKGNTMLKTIEDCVGYSDKVISDLMDYSGEIKLDKIKTNPRELVKKSLTTIITPSNVQIVDETSDEVSVSVDRGKIERVFSNLIKNACDAMPNGGQLRITNRKVYGKIEISVCDSGIGMSKEVLQKLWTPFFTTKAKGMGIGLGICKRIIEAHEGKIEVQSVEQKGTCFSVFLPEAD